MPKKPTAADAQLAMQLYDLRRETEIRKARNWYGTEFWPQSADDYMKVAGAFGTQENAWLRQISGYWDMAAVLVLHGTLNEDLFLEPGIGGEMFFTLAKIHPFLKDIRERMNSPRAYANMEKLATRSKKGRELFAMIKGRVDNMRKTYAKKS
jgi:hypothetical protein